MTYTCSQAINTLAVSPILRRVASPQMYNFYSYHSYRQDFNNRWTLYLMSFINCLFMSFVAFSWCNCPHLFLTCMCRGSPSTIFIFSADLDKTFKLFSSANQDSCQGIFSFISSLHLYFSTKGCPSLLNQVSTIIASYQKRTTR